MPISKERAKLYPDNWKWLSRQIREGAKWECELCGAKQGEAHWKTGSKVVLTVHHIDFNPTNNDPKNLLALCQRCHLKLDIGYKVKNRKRSAK